MPGRLTIDDHEIRRSIGASFGSPERLLKDASLDPLALPVLTIELAGNGARLVKLIGTEQSQSELRVFETTGCVETRSQLKAGLMSGNIGCDLGNFHECEQSATRGLIEPGQTCGDKDAVFADQRHDISDGR